LGQVRTFENQTSLVFYIQCTIGKYIFSLDSISPFWCLNQKKRDATVLLLMKRYQLRIN
jgi:hypothetical protein